MKRHLGIFLRGMAMGAADLVPGVSGGTVALITGIYDDLLQSISAVSLELIDTWKNEGFQGVLRALNAPFLVALVAGIGTSIFALSDLLHHLLEHHKAALFAFFFGLVGASIPLVGREITQRTAPPPRCSLREQPSHSAWARCRRFRWNRAWRTSLPVEPSRLVR